MQKQKGISTLIGIIIIVVVAVIAFGGVFAYQYFFMPKEQNSTQNPIDQTAKSEITSFSITPSQKTAQGIVYEKGSKATVIGQNLTKVEFYQRGGGTNVYTSSEGGLIGTGAKVADTQWELSSLPSERLMVQFCAVGFDKNGKKIGEICLSNVAGPTEESKTDIWKNFISEEKGFSFLYPNYLYLASTPPKGFVAISNSVNISIPLDINFDELTKDDILFTVAVTENISAQYKNVEEWAEHFIQFTEANTWPIPKLINKSSIKIDGIQGIQMTFDKSGVSSKTLYIINNNKGYAITYQPVNSKYTEDAETIISTFKFTK